MKSWREETQPELLQVALDARDVPLAGRDEPREALQGADGSELTEVLQTGALRDPWSGAEGLGLGGAEGLGLGGAAGLGVGLGGAAGLVSSSAEGLGLSSAEDLVSSSAAGLVPSGAAGSVSVHDPDEVTIQHDVGAVRIRPPGAADASDAPVFVDESGRRSRRFRRLGMAVGLACAVYAVVIVVTLLSGSSDAPWLPVPGQNDDRPASKVDDSPQPARSARSSGDGAPVAGPVVSGGTAPSARASSRMRGAGKKGAVRPSASASAHPTSPAGATGSPPKPGSSSAAASPSPVAPSSDAPTPAASSPPASPSDSPAPTGGPVAEGAAPRNGTGAASSSPAPVL
ncbi:hypothetical protein ABZ357_24480 [Streptomyces sp. NPDC005917]|uniref:hypothetical protein n=1 Tax=unclassified Streptomyces TaxID=2593676 RepID=UPI0033C9A8ED